MNNKLKLNQFFSVLFCRSILAKKAIEKRRATTLKVDTQTVIVTASFI
jgi:hypothetical protein